jgi:hypothetical protein
VTEPEIAWALARDGNTKIVATANNPVTAEYLQRFKLLKFKADGMASSLPE